MFRSSSTGSRVGTFIGINRCGTTGENQRSRLHAVRDKHSAFRRHDAAVDPHFPHAPCDELHVLRPEVDDEHAAFGSGNVRTLAVRALAVRTGGLRGGDGLGAALRSLLFARVVGRFFGDLNVVGMGLAQAGRGDADELGAVAEFVERSRSDVAHA